MYFGTGSRSNGSAGKTLICSAQYEFSKHQTFEPTPTDQIEARQTYRHQLKHNVLKLLDFHHVCMQAPKHICCCNKKIIIIKKKLQFAQNTGDV
jgi:hypothetical protein